MPEIATKIDMPELVEELPDEEEVKDVKRLGLEELPPSAQRYKAYLHRGRQVARGIAAVALMALPLLGVTLPRWAPLAATFLVIGVGINLYFRRRLVERGRGGEGGPVQEGLFWRPANCGEAGPSELGPSGR